MTDKCRHGRAICSRCVIITDAAKRMSGNINAHVVFTDPGQLRGSWLAIRLADGSCDGVLYGTKADAIRHQLHEQLCLYFPLGRALGGANPKDCQILLDLHRHIYDAGGRLADAEAPDLIVSTRGYDILTGRVNPRHG